MKRLTDLLDLDFVFTQRRLLNVSGFARELKRRGVSLLISDNGHLEAFHKERVLIPLYQVRKDIRAIKAAARQQEVPISVALQASISTRSTDLLDDRDRGYLLDPRTNSFQPWNRYQHTFENHTINTRDFLYSYYQLLLMPSLREVAPRVRIRRDTSKVFRFRLHLTPFQREDVQHDVATNDRLLVILSALEPVYLPSIIGRLSLPHGSFEAWEQFRETFEPGVMLRWLEWEPSEIVAAAERLLSRADTIDPLSDWIELTRLIRPSKWEKLRGDALVAMDYRIAAEMLLRFYEDLAELGIAPQLEPLPRYASHPLQERLKTERMELDHVLTDFGISPHPSLVVFLEGETEMLIIPRVMNLLGIPTRRSLIELHLAQGNNPDISRYALYIAPPALGESIGDAVMFTRPPTHFLLIVDHEDAFLDPEQVARKKKQWIDKIVAAIRQQYQIHILRDDVEQLFEVRTWETGNFEFAHFTNAEIIQAINNVCHNLGIIPIRVLQEDEVETRRQHRISKNVAKLWKDGALGRPAKERLSKLKLAEALWPILEQKIETAIQEGKVDHIPVAKVLLDAYQLALNVRRHDVVIRQAPDIE